MHFGLNLEMVSTGTDSCLTLSLLQLTSITEFNDTDFQFNRTQVLAQRMKVRQRKRGKKESIFLFQHCKACISLGTQVEPNENDENRCTGDDGEKQ